MLDLRYLIDHFDEVRAKLARRGEEAAALLDSVREPSAERLRLIRDVEDRKHRLKNESKSLGKLPKGSEEFHTRRAELRLASEEIKGLENEGLARVEERIREILLLVPNLPDDSIPDGGDQDARVERVCGTLPTFDFAPKAHWDLGPELGIIDFERAARISGSRFAVMIGAGARLERALVQLMMDVHASRGYTEVIPPYLVGSEAMTGTGQLPKFAEDAFRVQGADLWLVPTAEVPVTNLHANEILEADDLPLRYAAFTPCFRSEKFTRPEQSDEALSDLVREAELILEKLELHYRVVTLAAGDMGFSASRCLDIEVWIPSLESFREISSCSNCRDFQARRARIRFRPEPKAKPKLVHTLNGSALAVGRAVIALLEQHQQADGTVRIPEALRPYMGTDVIKGVIKGV